MSLVAILVVGRRVRQKLRHHFRGALGHHPRRGVSPSRLQTHHCRHALQRRAEVVSVLDGQRLPAVPPAGKAAALAALPPSGVEGRELQGVSHQRPVHHDQRLAAHQHTHHSIPGLLGHVRQQGGASPWQPCDALEEHVVAGERPSLVETAHVHLSGHHDAEGLGAEDPLARQGQQRGIDGDGELHGELGGNDAGNDHAAVQEKLEARPVHLLKPVVQHICRGQDGKEQQEQDEHASLPVVGRHPLRTVQNGPHQLPLGGVEAGPQHHGQAAAVGGADARIFVGPRVLQDARPAEQDLRLIPFDVEAICAHQGRLIHGLFVRCAQRIFPLRSGFACKHSLLHDGCASQ
mmetsp:Transcript_14275/g.43112  ORF Transcript_14275/g.43112 Transcript_14275/m.43112 type:complete len:348 (+) Transcript_14275:2185-3228(+)